MNKKLLELLDAINAQKKVVVDLTNEDKLDEAKAAKEELVKMQEKFDLLKDMEDAAPAPAPVPAQNMVPAEPKHDAVHEFAEAARHGFRVVDATAAMTEGTNTDGGYTVPEDIKTQVNKFKEAEFDLSKLTASEKVTTDAGRRTYQSRAQVTGFTKVGEGAKIGQVGGPKFEVVEYAIAKYAGFLPVTNELLSDSDANITATIAEWLAKQDVATRNSLILAVWNAIPEKAINKLDDIKKIINVSLGAAFAGSISITTNDDGLNWLDTLKDGNQRYLLSPDPVIPMQTNLSVGAKRIPVNVVPNAILASASADTKTSIPLYIGSTKDSVKVFDRNKLTISNTIAGAAGSFNAFEQDMTLFRAIERLDVKALDPQAMVHATLTV